MLLMVFPDICQEVQILDIESAAFVEQVVNAFGWGVNEFKDFEIVSEVEVRDARLEAFWFEDFLFLNEDLLEVNLVNFFVGEINAKLLKTIFFEDLKPVNVE